MRDFAKAFYYSPTWRKARRAYINKRKAIDGGLCEICGNALGYIVHHKTWLTPDNIGDTSVTLNENNLQYVCHDCHNRIEDTSKNKNGEQRYIFGADGEVLPPFRKNYDR